MIASSSSPRNFEQFITTIGLFILGRASHNDIWHRQYIPAQFDEFLQGAGFSIEERRYSFFLPFPLDVLSPRLVPVVDRLFAGSIRQSLWGRPFAKTYIVKGRKLATAGIL